VVGVVVVVVVVGVVVVVDVVDVDADDEDSPDELPLLLLFELPYPSEYQPPPFKMKFALVIWRRA
jgi:hypothetical protein